MDNNVPMTTDHNHLSDRLGRELLAQCGEEPIGLAHLPGIYLAAGMDDLPHPPDQTERDRVVDVPGIGRVRVTYCAKKGRRGAQDFWTPNRAVLMSKDAVD